MSAESGIQPSDAPLQFDRAVHADPAAAGSPACARCSKPIIGTYYHDGAKTLCADCGKMRQQLSGPDRSTVTLLRAVAFGAGAAVAGAAVYYAVMEYLGLEIGIVAILIGWMVGTAIVKATNGRSARRHQVLAVMLTYLAVALAYAPYGIKEDVASGLIVALPILAALGSMPGGLLSMLIIGFGLRRAWRISGASNIVVTGPHSLGGATA